MEPVVVDYQPPQRTHQQSYQQNNQGKNQKKYPFDPIPMSYAELFPVLVQKNLVQTRSPPVVFMKLP